LQCDHIFSKEFFYKKTLIYGELFWGKKKRNLRENIPVSFFGHPGAKIGPKNK
jgi:hypothetical protein